MWGGGGNLHGNTRRILLRPFLRPLLIKDILDKVERFCRAMERGGGESAWEYEENFVEVFSRLLFVKNIPGKVERFFIPM